MSAGLQATLQTLTDPNAPGGANVFLGTLVLGFSAINGALSAYAPQFPNIVWERCGDRQGILCHVVTWSTMTDLNNPMTGQKCWASKHIQSLNTPP